MTPSAPASTSFCSCALVSSAFSKVLLTVMISSYMFHTRRAEEERKGAWGPIYTGISGEERGELFSSSALWLSPRNRKGAR